MNDWRWKHGLIHHPLYFVWKAMNQRCSNPKAKPFPYYGGRGIAVCFLWRKQFLPFYKWAIANGWAKGLMLERKNNNSGYSPSNCTFTTRLLQNRNRRCNKLTMNKVRTIRLRYDAGLATAASLAKEYKVSQNTMSLIVHGQIWKEDAP